MNIFSSYRKISGDGIDRSVVELWNGSNELTHKMIAELLKADERANQVMKMLSGISG